MPDYLQALNPIVTGVIAENASAVDRDGAFPQAGINALSETGLMGLISAADVGGMGQSLKAAAHVVEKIAAECASTAMVMCMHYSGTAVLERYGPESIRRAIAEGRHLSTLAFSERGSRSQFWAPLSTATKEDGRIRLNAEKSWVTSAHHANAYVWSSQPVEADGLSTLWLVSSDSEGLEVNGRFDGLGLRGNDSTGVTADKVFVDEDSRLGADGAGLDIMLALALPTFNVLASATSVGLMRGAVAASVAHASTTRFEHTGSKLSDLPTLRSQLAAMQINTDSVGCLLYDTVDAIHAGREDAQLRILESKAAAGEASASVMDLAMRVCGGSAFRKEVGVERRFRDARAGLVMAPTTEQLHDFIGKALCGLPVF